MSKIFDVTGILKNFTKFWKLNSTLVPFENVYVKNLTNQKLGKKIIINLAS
jgi:hypothetical protein